MEEIDKVQRFAISVLTEELKAMEAAEVHLHVEVLRKEGPNFSRSRMVRAAIREFLKRPLEEQVQAIIETPAPPTGARPGVPRNRTKKTNAVR